MPTTPYSLSSVSNGPVASGITATGASATIFAVQPTPDGDDRTMVFSAVGVGAVPTAITVDLEISTDGQATWQKFSTGLALVAASTPAPQKVTNVPAGPNFRINATTVTLGSASSVTVNASCN